METGVDNSSLKSTKYCKSNKEKIKNWEFNKGMPDYYERLKAKVCYQRFGFYNSIIMKFKAEEFAIMAPLIQGSYHTVGDNFYQNKKEKHHFSRQNSIIFQGEGNEIHHRPYQSTRRLIKYFVSVYFSWDYTDGAGYHTDNKTLTIQCPD